MAVAVYIRVNTVKSYATRFYIVYFNGNTIFFLHPILLILRNSSHTWFYITDINYTFIKLRIILQLQMIAIARSPK